MLVPLLTWLGSVNGGAARSRRAPRSGAGERAPGYTQRLLSCTAFGWAPHVIGSRRIAARRRVENRRATLAPVGSLSRNSSRRHQRKYAAKEIRERKNDIHAFAFTTHKKCLSVPRAFFCDIICRRISEIYRSGLSNVQARMRRRKCAVARGSLL
uniref:Uncharacterized protein n=1 Tax=Ixodes ricinus TaxID=34613 RepID=A0A147BFL6_IXORI